MGTGKISLMEYEKKELDPSQYLDILRALHITSAIITDAIMALAKMEIIDVQDAVRSSYRVTDILDKVGRDKQFVIVDKGDKFTISVRR